MKKELQSKRLLIVFAVFIFLTIFLTISFKNIRVVASTGEIDISSQVTIELKRASTQCEIIEVDGVEEYIYKYTGEEIRPPVTVYYPSSWQSQYGITDFQYNRDWTISYSSCTDVGIGTITVSGIGQFAGAVTKTFEIVSILPSEQKQLDEEKAIARTTRIILFVVLCAGCIAYALVKIFRIRKKRQLIVKLPEKNLAYLENKDKERTEQQKELFYKSYRYLDWKRKSEGAVPIFIKQINLINILSYITLGSVAIALVLSFFTDVAYVFDIASVGLVITCLVLSLIAKKNDVTDSFGLDVASITSDQNVCNKCAGDYQLFWEEASFANKDVKYKTETLSEGRTPYLGKYDEVTNMQRVKKTRTKTRTVGSGSTSRTEQYLEEYFEDVYTIKVVTYWYYVPAVCKSCEEPVVLNKIGKNPDELN